MTNVICFKTYRLQKEKEKWELDLKKSLDNSPIFLRGKVAFDLPPRYKFPLAKCFSFIDFLDRKKEKVSKG